MKTPVGIAVVGCGQIAQHYARSLLSRPDRVRLAGGYDIIPERTMEFATEYGGRAYPDFQAVLDDPEVQIVANLTTQQAHAEVSEPALLAGKHVHSEKPLACTREDGRRLLRAAQQAGTILSCSPFTFMGEAQQTAVKAIRGGSVGRVLAVYAEMNWGAIERHNARPIPFYQKGAGPLLDVGVYALTVLTAALGPVTRVTGCARIVQPERVIGDGPDAGRRFRVETPDQVVGCLEFECGAVGRLTASFRTGKSRQANGAEFHGELGSLILDSNVLFHAGVERWDAEQDHWSAVPAVRKPFNGVEWGRAVFDLVDALEAGGPRHCTGEQAFHVLDVCLGVLESAEQAHPVEIKSRFDLPPLMPWAE
nr:Gfo/Idh/MocA family oxidoreductase [Kiritimatiellota bacterium]